MAQLFSVAFFDSKKVISLFLLLLTILGGIIFGVQYLVGPIDKFSPQSVEVDIPNGSNLAGIAKALKNAGVIREALYFIILSRIRGVESQLKAGYYELSTKMSINQVIDKLVKGEVATFKLTIPEGLTIKEMATLIAEQTNISREEFLVAAAEYELDFFPEQDVEFQVEGFLFPDTYQIPLKVTPEELISIMVQRFETVIGTESVKVRGRSLNIWEIVTIAALIEEEAKLDADRPLVSGVIYNRLEEGMYLQLCASVIYALGVKKDRLSIADTLIDSPYNTYQHQGLPPGPISNPGLTSLKAALHPEDVPYFFYFALPDGTTFYCRTYEEHQKAVKKYLD